MNDIKVSANSGDRVQHVSIPGESISVEGLSDMAALSYARAAIAKAKGGE